MAEQKPLTELEGTVLGVVGSDGPCTPYRVRRVFLSSPSPYWSGSAGAIYPLMTRLEGRGLLRSKEHATGSRTGLVYSLTPAGRRALTGWLGSPTDDILTSVPPDPLRTRVAFLALLAPSARRDYLVRVQAGMLRHLARARRDRKSGPKEGAFDLAVADGAIAVMEARLRWIRRLAGSR